jgi:chromosome segregation ATPase
MARPGVTREQVFETAEVLAAAGVTPTVVAVRTRLGGGSPNNIAPWLAEWKAQREHKQAEVLPPLPEAVESAMRQVWGVAWKASQVQLEAERQALAELRNGLERERTEMLAEIQRLDSALDEAQAETRQTAETLEAERRAHEQTRTEVREVRVIAAEREKRIEDQAGELREARQQVAEVSGQTSRLEADLEHARADLERAKAQAAKLRDAQTALVAERDRALAEREQLSKEVDTVHETARQAKAGLDLGAKRIQKLEEALEEERRARTATEKALSDLRVEVATLTERAAQADGLRALLDGLRRLEPGSPEG